MNPSNVVKFGVATLFLASLAPLAQAQMAAAEATSLAQQSSDAELAKKLSNPLADLMSLPMQMNWDDNLGMLDEGSKLTSNFQPVIPFNLSDDWNLISRTILPVIYQEDIFPGSGSQFGLGDVSQSLFFSPVGGDITWGVGPIFLLPTATHSLLGGRKWGSGLTGVVLKQYGPWTVGALGNHIWSFAGDNDRPDISNTFVQPFISYTTDNAWTFSLQSETAYNWQSHDWSIPANFAISKMTKIGKVPVSIQGGVGYWLESPDAGPEGFRFRFQFTVLLPK